MQQSLFATLLPAAMGVVEEVFSAHQPMPFDISLEEMAEYALRQMQHRTEALQRPA